MPDISDVCKITVTTKSGETYSWEGVEGYVSIMSLAHRPEGAGAGAMAIPRARQVQAQLTIPLASKEVKELVEEEADPGVPL
jgi:hypothetical protein